MTGTMREILSHVCRIMLGKVARHYLEDNTRSPLAPVGYDYGTKLRTMLVGLAPTIQIPVSLMHRLPAYGGPANYYKECPDEALAA